MSSETDKDKKTAPAQAAALNAKPAAAEAPKTPQASPKPSVPAQQQASSPAPAKTPAPVFSRRRVWPD